MAKSLSAKVFLIIAATLTASSVALYLTMALALPEGYNALIATNAQVEADELIAKATGGTEEDVYREIETYCTENDAAATVSVDGGQVSFGAALPEDEGGTAYDFAAAVELEGGQDGVSHLG